MKGKILHHRIGLRQYRPNECLAKFEGYDSMEKSSQLIGRRLICKTSKGKVFRGKIVKVHGKKGVVIIRFKKGIPKQLIGKEIELI